MQTITNTLPQSQGSVLIGFLTQKIKTLDAILGVFMAAAEATRLVNAGETVDMERLKRLGLFDYT
jgi:hypothetical protein